MKKGGVGGLSMLLAGYCVLSYIWSYPHLSKYVDALTGSTDWTDLYLDCLCLFVLCRAGSLEETPLRPRHESFRPPLL